MIEWVDLWKRLFLIDPDDELVLTMIAKLDTAGETRRGRLFLSRARLCFCPHVFGGKQAPPVLSSFSADEAIKLPLSNVVATKESGYMGLSARILLSASGASTTSVGSMILRGLGDRRDVLFAALEKLQQLQDGSIAPTTVLSFASSAASSSSSTANLGNVEVVWPVLRALEERLDERWSGDVDEHLAAGLLAGAARDDITSLDTADAATLWGVLLRALGNASVPVIPTWAVASLLDTSASAAVLLKRLDSAPLLRALVYLIAAADGSPATQTDARTLTAQLAPALSRLEDPIGRSAVLEFLLRLVKERRTLK